MAEPIDAASLTHILTLDRTNPSSILSCVAAGARESAPGARAVQLGNVGAAEPSVPASKQHHGERSLAAALARFFSRGADGSHLFQGVTDSTMSHGEGWQYIQLGRFVERTDDAGQPDRHALQVVLPHPLDQAVESEEYLEWVGLLKSCAAFEAYCKTYTAEIRPLRVAEFLLLNPEFPHSVRFSVDRVHAALVAIGELTERKAEQPVRLAGSLRATLSFSQIEEIMASGANGYVEGVCAGSARRLTPRSTRSISIIGRGGAGLVKEFSH
jgi:uncharacterized alpha-E superfamily protein